MHSDEVMLLRNTYLWRETRQSARRPDRGGVFYGQKPEFEGEQGTSRFILTKGTVRITKYITLFSSNPEHADIEKDLITLTADDNPVFGEMALLERDERTATVIALTDVELLSIEGDDFDAIAKKDYESAYHIVMSIACMLSFRLRRTNKDVVKLTTVLGVALARDRMN